MENNNLKLIPKLLEKTDIFIDKVDKVLSVFAKALKERPKAEIPPEELEKVKMAIENTPCAMPDTIELGKEIAKNAIDEIKADVETAIKDQIASTRLRLEHHHTHYTTWQLAKMAEGKCKTWLGILSCLCGILLLLVFGGSFWYLNSDEYWGKRYMDIVQSEFVTEEEHELLLKATYSSGVLPKEYYSNPGFAKAKIKQNELVLKERKSQAMANKGKWKATVPIERMAK